MFNPRDMSHLLRLGPQRGRRTWRPSTPIRPVHQMVSAVPTSLLHTCWPVSSACKRPGKEDKT